MLNLKEGFTLIELLVTIAIIGILSGVVLTSLNSARIKAKDARIISNTKSARTILELGRGNGNFYPDLVTSFPVISRPEFCHRYSGCEAGAVPSDSPNYSALKYLSNDTIKQGNSATVFYRVISNPPNEEGAFAVSYAIYSRMTRDSNLYFCADSGGKTGFVGMGDIYGLAATCL
ncbi:MAG: type II secretion system protein [Candidatus Paceibacterota bacterium]|jgi:prepilin-type N-terminal cleavage/methylation domain-containing protein